MVSFCLSIYIEDLSKTSLKPQDISRTSSAKIRQMVIKLHDGTPAALMTPGDTDSQLLKGKQANKRSLFPKTSRKQEVAAVYLTEGQAGDHRRSISEDSNPAGESDCDVPSAEKHLKMKPRRLSWSRCSHE